MMTFVNMNSPALLILPTHRVVHSLPLFDEEAFRNSARNFFDIEEVDSSLDAPRATAMLRESGRAGTTILAVTPNRAFLLHHPNPNAAQVFAGLSMRQQSLDVVQLHKVLLENVLNLTEESIRNQQNISYVRDAAEALSHLASEPSRQHCFSDEPLPHDASPRHRLRRRSHAPEIHRLLPQAPQRTNGLCPRLTGHALVWGQPPSAVRPGKARHPAGNLARSRFA